MADANAVKQIPEICTLFPFSEKSEEIRSYLGKMGEKLMPFIEDVYPFADRESLARWSEASLPIVHWELSESNPGFLTVTLLCRPTKGIRTESLFIGMMKRCLVPNQEVSIPTFDHLAFYFDGFAELPHYIAQATVFLRTERERTEVKENLPIFRKDLMTAIRLPEYARSILDMKAVAFEERTTLIQDQIGKFVERFPSEFGQDVFSQIAYFHTHTSTEFKLQRHFRHLARMFTSLYLLRERVEREVRALPEKRHLQFRFIQTELSFTFGKKPVLGMAIGVNLFDKHESFEEKHILLSIQRFIPEARVVPGSFYTFSRFDSSVLTLYLDLEKSSGERFSLSEVKELEQKLSNELSKRIEFLVPSIFVVRNEEETMRNIFILSQEIKSETDIPQVMISFDQHSQSDLTFTVVLLRVRKGDLPPIQKLLHERDQRIHYTPDRVQIVSYLDKDTPIEANVFRLKITKLASFLRMNFSVNLYLARQEIVSYLMRSVGEIRDYNGGMILKQGELLNQFKRLFDEIPLKNKELLENFFYSLSPIESQATIPLQILSEFFGFFLQIAEKEMDRKEHSHIQVQEGQGNLFVVIKGSDFTFKTHVQEHLQKVGIQDRSLVTSSIHFEGIHYLSYYSASDHEETQKKLVKEIKRALKEWQQEKQKLQVLKFNIQAFLSLDPRVGGDQDSSIIIKMLFNGLMRIDAHNKPVCSVAESYEISDDQTVYTFHLRESKWSNGTPVVARDFEYSWKKILSPEFSTAFAYVFYSIKNAKEAKEGKVPMESVGIQVVDDKTLVVNLKHPAPYFLELTALTLYSPVNHAIDTMHPNWSSQCGDHFVCNGPFKLRPSRPFYFYELERNTHYWDQSEIYLDEVHIAKTSARISFEMYKNDEIDLIGNPLFPLQEEMIDELKDPITHYSNSKILWFRLNVRQFPFNSVKIRRAFAHGLNRERMGAQSFEYTDPAYSPLPTMQSLHVDSEYIIREDKQMALQLFEEACNELGITVKDIPIITIICFDSAKQIRASEALKSGWEGLFGVKCQIEVYTWYEVFKKLTTGDYQVGSIHWVSWFNDPIYTLNCFKYKSEQVNFSGWENSDYQKLLDLADHELSLSKRREYLVEAEALLLQEVPVLPICHAKHWIIKKPYLQVPSFISPSCENIDFSRARIERS